MILANKNSNTQQHVKARVAAASKRLERVSQNKQTLPIRGLDTGPSLPGGMSQFVQFLLNELVSIVCV